MFNVNLSYKPLGYWRIVFWSEGHPSEFSCLEKFRSLVVPSRGCRKGVCIQGIIMPTGVLPNGQLCLYRKGEVTVVYLHAPRKSNITYVQTVRGYLYKNIRPKQPHSPIHQYQQLPQRPAPRRRYKGEGGSLNVVGTFLKLVLVCRWPPPPPTPCTQGAVVFWTPAPRIP